ncbi:MAG: ABC transporter permease [Thermoleophilia bacterium]|nr:ABC transporter permease [Thermoleophilia bacterium]
MKGGAAAAGRPYRSTRTRQVLLLAGHTWKEGVRRRMILVGFLLTLAFVVLYALGAYFSFRHFDPSGMGGVSNPALPQLGSEFFRDVAAFQMLSFGLFISSFLSAALVVFLAAGMISGDAENGTLQTIVTRPIARVQILLGRYLGYATIFLSYLAFLAGSLIAATWLFSGYVPPSPLQSWLLLAAEGLIVLSLVSLGTAVLPPVATGILVLMAYGLAFIGGVVKQIGLFLGNGTAESIGDAVHYLLPTDAFFRMSLEGLAPRNLGLFGSFDLGPFGSPSPVRLSTVAFGLVYLLACLTASALLFSRRDL